jgi:hypothetical protein
MRILKAFALALCLAAPSPVLADEGTSKADAPTANTSPQASLSIKGIDDLGLTLSAADISALPLVEVITTWKGETTRWEGPLFSSILARLRVPAGEALKGNAVNQVVLVRAADGFTTVVALADTDNTYRDTPIILARLANGKPLAAKDAPYRLVIGGDKRPSRSVRNVIGLSVMEVR